MPGIITSSSTMSHRPFSQISIASGPLVAVSTSKYSAERRASSSFRFGGMSSTTRTRAVIDSLRPEELIDGVEELGDRDRLRQISPAAALADLLLVALHRERGDGDDRNRAQLLVVLQPLRH